MDLVTNEFFSSRDYNASTMEASIHQAQSVVLNLYTELAKADLKDQMENSNFKMFRVRFGELPNSSHSLFWQILRDR